MSGADWRDSHFALFILFGFSALLALAVAMTLLGLSEWVAVTFDDGIGLKNAAILSAVIGVTVMILFAFAGGVTGEIQFRIPGFFIFFWLMIAWVFQMSAGSVLREIRPRA